MMITRVLMTMQLALASPVPCQFWNITPGTAAPAYDIDRAYAAATFVAMVSAVEGTGTTSATHEFDGQKAKIISSLKGQATGEIELSGIHGAGTDFNGTAIAPKGQFLVLLTGSGKLHFVDGGSGCPNSYEVSGGKVRFGKSEVEVAKLKAFFEAHPKPLTGQ